MAPQLQQRFYDFDRFRVDVSRRLLLRQGKPVPLTPKAFDILLVLVQNHGRVVGKDELMKLVWPETTVEENNLTRNISSLRKALEERPSEHRYIVTVPGRGYRFAAGMPAEMQGTDIVFERHARAQVLIEEQSETNTATQAIQPIKTGVVERRSWRWIGIRFTLASVACAILASSAWLRYSRQREAMLPPPRVVPLTSLPDRAECGSFSRTGIVWLFQGTAIRRSFLGSTSSRSGVTLISRSLGARATSVLYGHLTANIWHFPVTVIRNIRFTLSARSAARNANCIRVRQPPLPWIGPPTAGGSPFRRRIRNPVVTASSLLRWRRSKPAGSLNPLLATRIGPQSSPLMAGSWHLFGPTGNSPSLKFIS